MMMRATSLLFPAITLLTVTLALAQVPDLGDMDPFGDADAEQPADAGDDFGLDPGTPDGLEPEAATPQQELEQLFIEGKRLADEGKCDQAIGNFSQILASPMGQGFAPAALERAKCLVTFGELDLALQSLEIIDQFGARDPATAVEAILVRGNIQMDLQRFDEAVETFSQGVQSNPTDPEFLFLRGKSLIRSFSRLSGLGVGGGPELLDTALTSLKRTVEIDPEYAEAHAELGSVYLALEDYEKAVASISRAVELDDSADMQARKSFAFVAKATREEGRPNPDMDQVVSDYETAIESLDRYLASEGDKTKDDFEDADPETIEPGTVFLQRAQAKIALANLSPSVDGQKLYEEAVEDCDRALAYEPNVPGTIAQRGVAQRLAGDLKGAIDSYTEALTLVPNFGEARLRRGIIWYRLGDNLLARADFRRAAEDLSRLGDGRSQFWAGVTYAKEGDYQHAIRLYSDALRLNPEYKPALNNRGLAYMRRGIYDRAAMDFGKLVTRNREDVVSLRRRDQAQALHAQSQRALAN